MTVPYRLEAPFLERPRGLSSNKLLLGRCRRPQLLAELRRIRDRTAAGETLADVGRGHAVGGVLALEQGHVREHRVPRRDRVVEEVLLASDQLLAVGGRQEEAAALLVGEELDREEC